MNKTIIITIDDNKFIKRKLQSEFRKKLKYRIHYFSRS